MILMMMIVALGVSALEIVDVKFGADARWVNMTEAFKKMKVNDDLYFGYIDGLRLSGKDPAPGVNKTIIIKYKDNDGSVKERSLPERSFSGICANVPPAMEKFTFGRVFWGDQGKFIEVTDNVRSLVDSNTEFTVNSDTFKCADPCPGKEKYLIIFYSLDKEQLCENFKERSKFKGSMISGIYSPIPLAAEIKSPFKGMELDTAVWQWSIPMAGTCNPENNLQSTAFLYIPPKTKKLRGVVAGQYNMLERPIMEHPKFREYLQKLDYGCIWIAPTPFGKPNNGQFNFRNPEHAAAVDRMFKDLAEVSGYKELADIPFVGLGHSAMADFPYQIAAWKPERAIAGISFDGTAPGVNYNYEFGKDQILNDEALTRLEYIPFLFRSGGVGGGTNLRALVVRKLHPALAITVIMDPGSSHFDINDNIIDYMGKYLIKADKARGVGSMPLKKVDVNTGWYVDYWRYNGQPQVKAAPAGKFQAKKGPRGDEANWVIDEEHATFHEAHEALYRGKQVQLLAYVQEGKIIPDRKDHFQIHPKFIPEKDGLSFKIKAAFLDVVSEGRAPGWVGKKAGEKIEHGSDPQNIHIYTDCGPVVRLDDETMAVRFDRFGFTSSRRSGGFSMIAVHSGDDVYRRCVLQSEMYVPVFNKQGIRQYIDFPAIPDVKAGTKSLTLNAKCNTGMPVEYFVVHGPAYIKDNELIFTEVPAGAKYPVEVEVTAWQYGTGNEPRLQSARPVTQKFNITK